MGLDGIHRVTAISADAQRAFDAPDMYHPYFGDEAGSPGSILTFFEIRGAQEGHAGAGMISGVVFRVPSEASLAFWAGRLGEHAITGIAGIRAQTAAPDLTREMPERIGFADEGVGRVVTTGAERRGPCLLDEGRARRGSPAPGPSTTSRGRPPTRNGGPGGAGPPWTRIPPSPAAT